MYNTGLEEHLSPCLELEVNRTRVSKVARRLNPVRAYGSGGITSESPSVQRAFVICRSSSLFCSIMRTGAVKFSEIIVYNDKIMWCQSGNTIT
jgi:hypothetical protein